MSRIRTEIEADDLARTVNQVARNIALTICVAPWLIYSAPPLLFLGLFVWVAFWAGEPHDVALARRRFRRMERRRARRGQ